jgi:hypothetical protein
MCTMRVALLNIGDGALHERLACFYVMIGMFVYIRWLDWGTKLGRRVQSVN